MKKYILRIFLMIILVFCIYCYKSEVYAGGTLGSGVQWTLCNVVYNALKDFNDSTELVSTNGEKLTVLSIINSYVNESKQAKFESYTDINNKPNYPLTNPLIIHSSVHILRIVDVVPDDPEYVVYFNNDVNVNPDIKYIPFRDYSLWQNEGLFSENRDGQNSLTYYDLVKKLGCNISQSELKEGSSWNIVIRANVPEMGTEEADHMGDDGDYYKDYKIMATAVWEENEYNQLKLPVLDNSYYKDNAVLIYDGGDEREQHELNVGGGLIEAIGTVLDFVSHPKECIITLFLDLIKVVFGDAPQMLANSAQLGLRTWKIMFTPETLKEGKKYSYLDKYVGFAGSHSDETYQKNIKIEKRRDIKGNVNKERLYNYDEKSKIPVISVDVYTMATNKVDLVKANFLEINGDEIDVWLLIRNFVASLIHAIMYIVATFLIIGIIVNGIQLASKSIVSPKEKKEKKETIQRFAKGVIMLFGTLIIEAICLYASDFIVGNADIEDTYEGPIRVEVEEAGYSFSTTPTGYIRYMAEMNNYYLYAEKAVYVVEYVFLAWANLIFLISMTGRMIIMMILSVIGLLLVLKNVMSKKATGASGYKTWVISYMLMASMQVILALLAKFIIESITFG